MNILYDHQIFLNQRFGGPSRYFCSLIDEISKENLVQISAPFHINNHLKKLDKKFGYGFDLNNIFFEKFPTKIKSSLKKNLFDKLNHNKLIKKIEENKPDIIHKTYFDEFSYKTPTVLTVYDLIHEKFHYLYGKDENYRPKKKAIESADIIICISKNTQEDLNFYYDLKEKKTKVIYLASNLKFDKISNVKKNEKSYILFVGKRIGYKNFDKFLNAYSASNELRKNFKIKCFGGGEFIKAELKLINKMNININEIENIQGNDIELSYLYHNARALVYPSKYEGFGLPILEAMDNECPVICSNTSSLPEVGGESVVYFNPENIEEMSYKISETLMSDDKIKNLKIKGKERVKNFTWFNCAEETVKLYKSLI